MVAPDAQGTAVQEIIASEDRVLGDEKPNLINILDDSKSEEENADDKSEDKKEEEITTEPTKVIDLPTLPSNADEKKEEHKGLFHLGGKHDNKKEDELHLGTTMSSQAVNELISLSEEPIQNTGGDGFTSITSLDGSEVQSINNGLLPIPPTDI